MKTLAVVVGFALAASLVVVEFPNAQEPKTVKGPLHGQNSFTEGQAKTWFESVGYTHVADLTLGSDGVWRANARLRGVPALVRLDYKGNVSKH